MASYKDIQGFNIQNLTADPDNTGAVGQIYYNSTTGSFKAVEAGGIPAGTWASGGNTNTGVYKGMATGTSSAALKAGGYISPSIVTTAAAETYDGTSWTNITNMPYSARFTMGFGTQTSSVIAGGSGPSPTPYKNTSLEYNGSWSTGGNINTARRMGGGAGASITDGLIFGGTTASPDASGQTGITEVYNGTSWTEVGDRSNSVYNPGSAGTSSTNAIGAGGVTSAADTFKTETWNGTSWTEVADINSPKNCTGGIGSATLAVILNGAPGANTTEGWNGTVWTEVADIANARGSGEAAGNNSSASNGLYVNGDPYPFSTYTEEWSAPDYVIKTLTTS